jgi:hypothetical protein
MSMLHAIEMETLMSMLHVPAICPFRLSVLHVSVACLAAIL